MSSQCDISLAHDSLTEQMKRFPTPAFLARRRQHARRLLHIAGHRNIDSAEPPQSQESTPAPDGTPAAAEHEEGFDFHSLQTSLSCLDPKQESRSRCLNELGNRTRRSFLGSGSAELIKRLHSIRGSEIEKQISAAFSLSNFSKYGWQYFVIMMSQLDAQREGSK